MSYLTLKLTMKETELLVALVSDQMFRREFIDPKFPGHKANQGDIALGKGLMTRLRTLMNPDAVKKALPVRVAQ
ncbi:MAG: hypothetical protein NTV70_13490 [Acidobacteria bacterium]|nr:hypothetical protein [Acidobacteriota bacterium]